MIDGPGWLDAEAGGGVCAASGLAGSAISGAATATTAGARNGLSRNAIALETARRRIATEVVPKERLLIAKRRPFRRLGGLANPSGCSISLIAGDKPASPAC